MRVASAALLFSVGSSCTRVGAFSAGRGRRFAQQNVATRLLAEASADETVTDPGFIADDATFPSDCAETIEINDGGDDDDSSAETATPSPLEINDGDVGGGTAATPDSSDKADRTALINDLLRTAASSDRGQFATPTQKETVAAIVSSLEGLNPTAHPTESSSSNMIEGTWDLLYSSTQLFRSSPFFMAGRAVCETDEQAQQYDWFCDMHRAALAISTIGTVRQIISADRMTSEFEVKVGAVPFLSDFTPFKYSGGMPFTIDGAIVSTADITPFDEGGAWEIFMDTVEIRGSNVPLLRQVLDAGLKLGSRDLGGFLEENVGGYTNPRPVFSTTYLDETLRISRDQDGKVFVYGKVSDVSEPTDYNGVDSDLGVLKLLEGFNDSITKFYI